MNTCNSEDDRPKESGGYRDFSMVQRDERDNTEHNNSNFPVRLHCLISEAAKDGQQHIISWQPHGRSFCIHRPKEFVEQLLPLWFSQKKLESFQRQLNIYGFSRVHSGPDRGSYYHECFLRGKDFLAARIARGTGKRNKKKVSGTGGKSAQPNFYAMPPLPSSSQLFSDMSEETTTLPEELLSGPMFSLVTTADQVKPDSIRNGFQQNLFGNSPAPPVSPPLPTSYLANVTSMCEWTNTRNRMSALASMNDLVLQMAKSELDSIAMAAANRDTANGAPLRTNVASLRACPPFAATGFVASTNPIGAHHSTAAVTPHSTTSASMSPSSIRSSDMNGCKQRAATSTPPLLPSFDTFDRSAVIPQLTFHPLTAGLFTNVLHSKQQEMRKQK